MACALIESPEDYSWIDSERSAEIAAEFNSEQELSSRDEAEFGYNIENDHSDNKLNDHENRVYSF